MMNDDNFKIRFGSLEPIEILRGDATAVSVTLIMYEEATEEQYRFTSAYDADGEALLYIEDVPVGVYEYQVNENYASGDPSIYPDPDDCTDDSCNLPTIEVCYSIPEEGGSS